MKKGCLYLLIGLFALVGVCTTFVVGAAILSGFLEEPATEDALEAEREDAATPTPTVTPTPTPYPAIVWTPIPLTATPTPVPTPTVTPTPAPTPTATAAPVLVATAEGDPLVITVSTIPPWIPAYDRDEWDYGIDVDRDCQYTRHEVLIAESRVPVAFTNARECTVETGEWFASYTGMIVTNARQLEIDHFIPLANAHRSGGWQWSSEMKREFANNLDDPAALIAVTSSANRSKSDKGPDRWQPPDTAFWCQYAKDWIGIKHRWGLIATAAEARGLQEMLETCPEPVNVRVVERG